MSNLAEREKQHNSNTERLRKAIDNAKDSKDLKAVLAKDLAAWLEDDERLQWERNRAEATKSFTNMRQ